MLKSSFRADQNAAWDNVFWQEIIDSGAWMKASERDRFWLKQHLGDDRVKILLGQIKPLTSERVKQIIGDEDPWGKALADSRDSNEKRQLGQFLTPPRVVRAMLKHATRSQEKWGRVVDVGAGSGRFSLAALEMFPNAKLIAIEPDPWARWILLGRVLLAGCAHRCTVLDQDFCTIEPAELNAGEDVFEGRTLFLSNPPFVRHHDLSKAQKDRYHVALQRYGLPGSRLAGLHAHLWVHLLAWMKEGDRGVWITSAEWLQNGYGKTLRHLLSGPLQVECLFMASNNDVTFDDALVSACITSFTKPTFGKNGEAQQHLVDCGKFLPNADIDKVLKITHRGFMPHADEPWIPSRVASSAELQRRSLMNTNTVALDELFTIGRGYSTGSNNAWARRDYAQWGVPAHLLKPVISAAKEIIEASASGWDNVHLHHMLVLPDVAIWDTWTEEERGSVERFLNHLEKQGVHQTATARTRSPWWKMSLRPPPLVLMTYMGRRPPRFALNTPQAHPLNIAHGFWAKSDVSLDHQSLSEIIDWLNHHVSIDQGRTYGGGLVKFEPGEVKRLRVPRNLIRT